jgi:RimJ/RimL family protein N-acetyltransferase
VVVVEQWYGAVLVGEVGGVGFQGRLGGVGVVVVEIDQETLLLGDVRVGILDAHVVLPFVSAGRDQVIHDTRDPPGRQCDAAVVNQIDAGRLVLAPIFRPVARMLLDGGIPKGLNFAPGYPSRFSLEVMEAVVEAQEPGRFGPYFIVRKADGAVVGEIGCSVEDASDTGYIGYTVVQPCWGQGYATEALRALLAHVLAEPGIRRVVAETMVGHTASRRVMEKVGMRHCGARVDIEDGVPVELVSYEAFATKQSEAY